MPPQRFAGAGREDPLLGPDSYQPLRRLKILTARTVATPPFSDVPIAPMAPSSYAPIAGMLLSASAPAAAPTAMVTIR